MVFYQSLLDIPFISSTYVLNQCALVLEGVTLAQVVEFVVKVFVDLAACTVLDEKAAENTETAHPDNLARSQSEPETPLPDIQFSPHT